MKVDIHLEGTEDPIEAEELLLKALKHHREGVEHKEAFHQPAARDVMRRLMKAHEKALKAIYKEVGEVIDDEVFR